MNPIQINKTEINVTVIPNLDGSAYATGDVLFVPTQVNVLDYVHPTKKLRVRVSNVTVIDVAQAVALDLHFFNGIVAPPSYGALNAAQALTGFDAFNAGLRGMVQVPTYLTVSPGVSLAHPPMGNAPWVITLPAGQRFMWLAATTRGAPSYVANAMKIILGLEIINDVHA